MTLSSVIVLMTLLGAAVWYAMPSLIELQKRHLAKELYANLKDLPDDQVRGALFQISELGVPGLEMLVLAAGSHRHAIAEISQDVLQAELSKRRMLNGTGYREQTGAWTAELARSLSNHASNFGFSGKQWVAALTVKLVDMTEDFKPDHTALVLKEAEEILDLITPIGPRMRTMSRGTIEASKSFPQPAEPDFPLEMMAIPSEQVIEAANENRQVQPSQEVTPQLTIARQPSENRVTRVIPNWQPEWQEKSPEISVKPDSASEIPHVAKPLEKVTSDLLEVVIDVPTPDETRRYVEQYRGVSSEVLFEQLPLVDFYQAGAMRVVLKERGFDDRELEMVQRMTSADVKERLGVIENLSVLPASRARHWLKRLVRDENSEVRFRALSAIATTDDPQLYKIARELALHDNDERILKLASVIMKRKR